MAFSTVYCTFLNIEIFNFKWCKDDFWEDFIVISTECFRHWDIRGNRMDVREDMMKFDDLAAGRL